MKTTKLLQKKLIALCAIGFLFALNAEAQTITVKWQNSLSWSGTMHIYAWLPGGGELLGAWPGTPAQADPDNPGWFTHTFEGHAAVNVIFNNNNNRQTADIVNVTQSTCYRILNQGTNTTRPVEAVTCPAIRVTGVTLNKNATSLMVAGSEQLIATVLPANATNKDVTWSSSASGIATVVNGLVTGVSAGQATITVTTVDGSRTAQCVVTVSATAVPVTGVSLDKPSITLIEGNTEQLTATIAPSNATNQNVTWSSNNTNVATVSQLGLVTAVAAGSATITVTTVDGNRTATSNVTVNEPPSITVRWKNDQNWTGSMHIFAWERNGTPGTYTAAWPGTVVTPGTDGWYSHKFVNATSIRFLIGSGNDQPQTEDLHATEDVCVEILSDLQPTGDTRIIHLARFIDCDPPEDCTQCPTVCGETCTNCSKVFVCGVCIICVPPATYAVTFSVIGGNGTLAAAVYGGSAIQTGNQVVEGSTVNFTASPNTGFRVKEWRRDNSTVSSNLTNYLTVSNLAAATTVTVEFEAIPVGQNAITVTSTQGGQAFSNVGSAAQGTQITLTATPNDGFAFKEWVVVKGNVTLSTTTASPATFTMPNEEVEVNAVFEAIGQQYTITITNDGNGNALACEQLADANQKITLVAGPNQGFKFKEWIVVKGNVTLNNPTQNPTTFIMPNEDVEIRATFEVDESSSIVELDNQVTMIIYPNPATDKVYVQFSTHTERQVSIYHGTTGQIMQIVNTTGTIVELDVSTFTRGMYIIVATEGNHVTSQRVTVQ